MASRSQDWTPRKRLEETYRRLILRLLEKHLSFPTGATLGDITQALADWTGISRAFEETAIAIASKMATGMAVENARSWREAARKGSRGREIYEGIQQELEETGVGERVRQIIRENAGLISSIPRDVREMVNRCNLMGYS